MFPQGPKLAVCVKSCHRDLDAGLHNAIRATWGRDLKMRGADLFFFMGHDEKQKDTRTVRRYTSGEVVVDARDGYMDLPWKTKRICQWIGGKTFTHAFLCDTDTFVRAEKLLKVDYWNYDYLGKYMAGDPGAAPFNYTDEHGSYEALRYWASGGFGYFLSRDAAATVAMAYPNVWAEDMWVGQVLASDIDNKRIKAGKIDLDIDGITEHWNKKRLLTPFEYEVIMRAYQFDGFRNLFVKGIYVA